MPNKPAFALPAIEKTTRAAERVIPFIVSLLLNSELTGTEGTFSDTRCRRHSSIRSWVTLLVFFGLENFGNVSKGQRLPVSVATRCEHDGRSESSAAHCLLLLLIRPGTSHVRRSFPVSGIRCRSAAGSLFIGKVCWSPEFEAAAFPAVSKTETHESASLPKLT